MEAYRRFKQNNLFLSLKKGLAMVAQQVFVAEEWVHEARNEANAEALSRADVKKSLGALKQEKAELSEKLKEADKACLSVEAGLKTVERQAKDQRQKLHLTKIDLATQRQLVTDLKVKLQKAKEVAEGDKDKGKGKEKKPSSEAKNTAKDKEAVAKEKEVEAKTKKADPKAKDTPTS
ncbi:uncharacterized protein LOC126705177 [Quercus robur]|uniref:uncharacterized protein LOC126705177 n=1 Tax=Quercus robur TaxID=38942 RepID=UPI0021611596|nr:uncharacterized protein LOC126705177 [Quercus robur]